MIDIVETNAGRAIRNGEFIYTYMFSKFALFFN